MRAGARGAIVTWALAALVGACLWGCGSGSHNSAVATIAGASISKASVEHWVRILSVASYKPIPTEPAPKGVLPDPPSYSACVEWLGSAEGLLESRGRSRAQRKKLCEQRLQLLKKKALQFLLVYQWDLGEIKNQGLKIPEVELQRSLKLLLHAEALDKSRYASYLSATGMSEADMMVMQRITVYGDKINKEIQAKPSPTEMRRALVGFASKWVSRTSCEPGYVVPGCREYHGPESPP